MTSSANTQFDPYQKWFGIPPEHQPPNHYTLLGIELYEANKKTIDDAVETRANFLQDITDGPNITTAQKMLNDVAAARVCLTDKDLKLKYDAALRAHLENPVNTSTAFEFAVEVEGKRRVAAVKPANDMNTLILFGAASVLCLALVCGVAILKFGLGGGKTTEQAENISSTDPVVNRTENKKRRNLVSKGGVNSQPASNAEAAQTGFAPPVLHWDFESEESKIGAVPEKISDTNKPNRKDGGWSGKYARFDGKKNAIGIPDGTVQSEEGTISFRVRIPKQPISKKLYVMSSDNSKTKPSLLLAVRAEKDNKLVAVCNSKGKSTLISTGPSPYEFDKWMHVVITWKGSGKAFYFLNGKSISATGSEQATTPDPKNIIFGHNKKSDPTFTRMDLDDVRVYDFQLSPIEVSTLSTLK